MIKGSFQQEDTVLKIYSLKKFFFKFYLFLRERERQSVSQEGAEREGETRNLKQAPGSELSTQIPTRGSNP